MMRFRKSISNVQPANTRKPIEKTTAAHHAGARESHRKTTGVFAAGSVSMSLVLFIIKLNVINSPIFSAPGPNALASGIYNAATIFTAAEKTRAEN
jgi:hypothetical protein